MITQGTHGSSRQTPLNIIILSELRRHAKYGGLLFEILTLECPQRDQVCNHVMEVSTASIQ